MMKCWKSLNPKLNSSISLKMKILAVRISLKLFVHHGFYSKKSIASRSNETLCPKQKVDLCVLANHPAVHSGGVSRGGSVAVAVVIGDM